MDPSCLQEMNSIFPDEYTLFMEELPVHAKRLNKLKDKAHKMCKE